MHRSRIDGAHVAEKSCARCRKEVVDDDVRALDESSRKLAPIVRFEIDRERLLAAIHRQKVRADAAMKRRSPASRLIAAAGLFDFDHARAGISEHLRTQRTGEDAREVGDEEAV